MHIRCLFRHAAFAATLCIFPFGLGIAQDSEPTPSAATTSPPPPPIPLPEIGSLQSDWDVDGAIQFPKAIALSELCILAYNDAHSRNLTARLLGFEQVIPLDDGPMSGFMARKGDIAVIVFRGTNASSPRDWMTNLNFYFQSRMQGDMKFHEGFQAAYSRFSEQIKQTLREWKPSRLWLSGHSLGGAMSVCCAYDCLVSGIPVSGLITFGQPRVANPPMAKFINDRLGNRYLRFLNHKDLAPSVPAQGPAFLSDYQHAGRSAWINGKTIERNKLLMQSTATGEQAADGEDPSEPEVEDELDQLFAESPQEAKSPQESESVVAEENAITAEELNDLQFFLRSASAQPQFPPLHAQTTAQPAGEPTTSPLFMLNAGTVFPGNLPVQSSLQTPTMQLQGFANRFTDHSMLEYLRVLQEHHAKGE